MTGRVLVLTATDDHEVAVSLARGVVQARLAASAQVIGPNTSFYWWDGRPVETEEWQILIKSTQERFPMLEAHIRTHHNYELPGIIAIEIAAGSADYLTWISDETRQADV
ncbi:divalent-cation tolerance protein CutA [Nonomuraea sediminis]|uniref:divalent-cation tolerance protein CutA n=1 Tax=Nonomuraea sediminis TaxID=2835864 RepID=UPI001BDC56D2|nr:divalent-cation tolerance protein CutA [Nonomuraea sediminis]